MTHTLSRQNERPILNVTLVKGFGLTAVSLLEGTNMVARRNRLRMRYVSKKLKDQRNVVGGVYLSNHLKYN